MLKQSFSRFARLFEPVAKPDGKDAAYTDGKNLEVVCTLAKASGEANLLEIGTAFGHTAVALAKTCSEADVWTLGTCKEMASAGVSLHPNEILSRREQGNFISKQPDAMTERIHSLVGSTSRDRSLLDILAVPRFGFAFIDGDHSWRSVFNDTVAVTSRILEEGIVVWDDYGEANEVACFLDILDKHCSGGITHVLGTRICYTRISQERRGLMMDALRNL